MIYNLAHNGNKLITFTIDDTTYQAMNGMTWGEWVNSIYNTKGCVANTTDDRVEKGKNNYYYVGPYGLLVSLLNYLMLLKQTGNIFSTSPL